MSMPLDQPAPRHHAESDDEAAQGGVHKTFWGHLEDLRQALIRSSIVVVAALIVCLMFSDHIMGLLAYPLRHIDQFEHPKPTVTFQVGNQQLGPFIVKQGEFTGLPPGDAPHMLYRIGVAESGGQSVLTAESIPGAPTQTLRVRLRNLGPSEAFFTAFHISLYAAFVFTAPLWMYFLGGFILPALHVRERRLIFTWGAWGGGLFIVGVALTYFLLLPIALRASVEYSELLGFDGLDWQADQYITFVCRFLLGMGIGFQFPVVVLLLVKFGVIDHRFLARYRRHVCVLSFFLGAVLTTPEVITQVAMAIPLYVLYEACIWIAWYWDWKARRAAKAAAKSEA